MPDDQVHPDPDPSSPGARGLGRARARLVSFRVRMFRSIIDSGPVPVFPLTALVGRSESGKTSLLRALEALASPAPVPFSLERDWPRDRKNARSAEHVACEVVLRLEPATGDGVEEIRIGRTYAGGFVLESSAASGPRPTEAKEALGLLPPFVFLDANGLLGDPLEPAGLRGEPQESALSASARAAASLLSLAGISPSAESGILAPRLVADATKRLRRALASAGYERELALELVGGRLRLFGREENDAHLLPLEALSELERWRLTLAVAIAAGAAVDPLPPVLLLDHPGRSFGVQGTWRVRAELSRLAERATVVYTAPLPFRFDLQHPEQVLVLAPAPGGAVVPRGLAPERIHGDLALEAALGMAGPKSFLISDVNVVVEGATDAEILEALSELFRRSGEEGLPADANLAAAGGSYEVTKVASFLAVHGLAVVALFDSDGSGEAARAELEREAHGTLQGFRIAVLGLAQAAGLESRECAIEDLFPSDLYLEIARDVCAREGRPLLPAEITLPSDRTIAMGVRDVLGESGQRFPKSKVSEGLRDRVRGAGTTADLPAALVANARRLLDSIRSAVDAVR